MIKEYLKLVRIWNLAIAIVSVLAGFFLAAGTLNWLVLLALVMSVCFIFMSGNILNDYCDIAIDRLNRPDRPLPAGKIKPSNALVLGIVLLILGILVSIAIGLPHFVLAAGTSFLLILYNFYLKRMPFWGNLVIAFLGGLVFVYSGFGRDITAGCWFAAIFAFLVHLAREMVKDIEDMQGDITTEAETLPIKFGVRSTRILLLITLIILITATILPYIIDVFSIFYLIIVLFIVDSLLIFIIFKIIYAREKRDYSRISLLLKTTMITGLIALFATRIKV